MRGYTIRALPAIVLTVTVLSAYGRSSNAGEDEARTTSGTESDIEEELGDLSERIQYQKRLWDLVESEAEKVQSLTRAIEAAGVPEDDAASWALLFHRYGRKVQVDPRLLAAVVYYESGFDPTAYNPADPSWGLGQVMPRYWRYTFVRQCGAEATAKTLMDPEIAICYSAHIFAHYYKQHKNDPLAGITAYNNGTGHRNGYAQQVLYRKAKLSRLGEVD